jgi:inosine-uridine nucleoside N-ribohydrolase
MARRVFFSLLSLCIGFLHLDESSIAMASDHQTDIWIDTDPACGAGFRLDVDDCFALLYAFRSPLIHVVGIGTVFGNTDSITSAERLRVLLEQVFGESVEAATTIDVHDGAAEARSIANSRASDASEALATALEAQRLTVVALGPLTNIAALITDHPELAARIDAIVAVAGTRPQRRILHPGTSSFLHFHDLNFNLDTIAFETVLRSQIPLVLLPFEASENVQITARDLRRMTETGGTARWLAMVSEGWLEFWQTRLGAEGFRPFDSLAVGWVATPELFDCKHEYARIRRRRSFFFERDSLEVTTTSQRGRAVLYCGSLSLAFKAELMDMLTKSQSGESAARASPTAISISPSISICPSRKASWGSRSPRRSRS